MGSNLWDGVILQQNWTNTTTRSIIWCWLGQVFAERFRLRDHGQYVQDLGSLFQAPRLRSSLQHSPK